MKTTYATPAVILSGDVIRETKGSASINTDVGGAQQPFAPGAIGFNL